MALSTYVNFDGVRAALGVTSEELDDTVLGLTIYEDNLLEEMLDVSDSLQTAFDALLVTAPTTDAGKRLLRVSRLFCTYAVANQLLSSIPLFSPKSLSDGKATFDRYAADPYKTTIVEVRGLYQRYRTAVAEAFADYTSGSAPLTYTGPTLMAVASVSPDPVTGA